MSNCLRALSVDQQPPPQETKRKIKNKNENRTLINNFRLQIWDKWLYWCALTMLFIWMICQQAMSRGLSLSYVPLCQYNITYDCCSVRLYSSNCKEKCSKKNIQTFCSACIVLFHLSCVTQDSEQDFGLNKWKIGIWMYLMSSALAWSCISCLPTATHFTRVFAI